MENNLKAIVSYLKGNAYHNMQSYLNADQYKILLEEHSKNMAELTRLRGEVERLTRELLDSKPIFFAQDLNLSRAVKDVELLTTRAETAEAQLAELQAKVKNE